ncbi:MAG: leucyl/phenylalanyl-tRNA--protein transferase [Roseiflexaceae bacterium]
MTLQLTPALLIEAYSHGVFPMAGEDGIIRWYDPNPRAIIPLDQFHIPRRLARTVRNGPFEIRYDTAFTTVMERCAEPIPGREGTWISAEFIRAYTELHQIGFAHSVEAWIDNQLVGGLYGVAIRGLFAGESMFSRERDASKVCLVHLVERLRAGGYTLLDSQFITGSHMLQFGAIEIPRLEYRARLATALRIRASWGEERTTSPIP